MKPFTVCYCLLVAALSSAIVEGFHSDPPESADVPAVYEVSLEAEEPRHVQGASHEDFLVSVVPGQMAEMRDDGSPCVPAFVSAADRGAQAGH